MHDRRASALHALHESLDSNNAHSWWIIGLESQPPHSFCCADCVHIRKTNQAGLPLDISLALICQQHQSCTHQNAEVGLNENKLILTLKRKLEGYAKRLQNTIIMLTPAIVDLNETTIICCK